jgi:hypothetical protein
MRLNDAEYQAVTFWDAEGKLVIGARTIDGEWALFHYGGHNGRPAIAVKADDPHHVCVVGLDPAGYLHVCYDMHASPLTYRRSKQPIYRFDGTLEPESAMLGRNESAVTYPTFFNDPSGRLYFLFRDGGAGNGDVYFYSYDHACGRWQPAAGTTRDGLLLQGKAAQRSAYWMLPSFDPTFGASGHMHLFFYWSEWTNNSAHDVCYTRWDGERFTTIEGRPQRVPITPGNAEVVNPVAQGNFLTQHSSSACDSRGFPHAVYGRRGEDGYHHVYHTYSDGSEWHTQQISHTPSPGVNPRIAIDSTTDTAYVLYHDTTKPEGITVQRSAPGDFTTWTRQVLGVGPLHYYKVKFDPYPWERHRRFHMPIEDYEPGKDALPIRLLEWEPER